MVSLESRHPINNDYPNPNLAAFQPRTSQVEATAGAETSSTFGQGRPQLNLDIPVTGSEEISSPNEAPRNLTPLDARNLPGSSKAKTAWQTIYSRLRPSLLGPTRWWNISDFSIQLDDPHRLYGRNDTVTGSVSIQVTRPFRVTHAVVRLQGYAHVFRRPHAPGKRYDDRKRCENLDNTSGTALEPVYMGNGFVSLFESEQVICGEGRLGEGEYQLRFEMKFPDVPLPTGIDFERGSIGYYISALLTRPTTIAPTLRCERKIGYVENVDIAVLGSPKPRVLSLEPARVTKNKPMGSLRRPDGLDLDSEDVRAVEAHEAASVLAPESMSASVSVCSSGRQRLQTSYSRSMQPYSDSREVGQEEEEEEEEEVEVSVDQSVTDSQSTSNGNPSPNEPTWGECTGDGQTTLSPTLSGRRSRPSKRKSRKNKKRPIVTTIELARSGYLRGDSIPINVHVAHNKAVTSSNGVIVTLYRQARVNSNPGLLAPASGQTSRWQCVGRVEKSQAEGKTRLPSTTHVFRKDLAQSFASLLVNPATLTADIRVAVRVPDDAFPTIDCVPGRMISFRYFVEVVLDLNAKLTGLERVSHTTTTTPGALRESSVSPVGLLSPASAYSASASGPAPASSPLTSSQPGVYAPIVSSSLGPAAALPFAFAGPHFVDTGPVRRNKNIVACTFEVVIGSIDSDRLYPPLRARADGGRANRNGLVVESGSGVDKEGLNRVQHVSKSRVNEPVVHSDHTLRRDHVPDVRTSGMEGDASVTTTAGTPGTAGTAEPKSLSSGPVGGTGLAIEAPEHRFLSPLSEKERMRLAEDVLLPSAPPIGPFGSSFVRTDAEHGAGHWTGHSGPDGVDGVDDTTIAGSNVGVRMGAALVPLSLLHYRDTTHGGHHELDRHGGPAPAYSPADETAALRMVTAHPSGEVDAQAQGREETTSSLVEERRRERDVSCAHHRPYDHGHECRCHCHSRQFLPVYAHGDEAAPGGSGPREGWGSHEASAEMPDSPEPVLAERGVERGDRSARATTAPTIATETATAASPIVTAPAAGAGVFFNPLHPACPRPEPSAPMLDEDDDLERLIRPDLERTWIGAG